MNNLKSNECTFYASVLDSVTIACHKLCNPDFSCFDLRYSRGQTAIISPESWTLESPGVFRLGGFFFWNH